MTTDSTVDVVAAPRRRVRWDAVCGLITFVYLALWGLSLSLLPFARGTFNHVHRLAGNIAGRLVLCVVVLAVVFHAFDGLRRAVTDLFPATAAHDRVLRTIAVFLTWAVAVPSCAVVLWPFLSGRFG